MFEDELNSSEKDELNSSEKDEFMIKWAKYVQALRGVWVHPRSVKSESRNSKENPESNQQLDTIEVGIGKKKTVRVAITNFLTKEESWMGTASGKPDLSLGRYKRMAQIVNYAITLEPKPDYLIFPELSLPLKWQQSVANRLIRSGISLIAGTEYRFEKPDQVCSHAYLELVDDRLGYPSSIRISQPKHVPAPMEEKQLLQIHGNPWRSFQKNTPKRVVYNHNGFHFGVLICSELQNSKDRINFQGEVDALMVLAWNQDLETFSSLIESAALDVHTHVILVNNREYGDSRIRVPSKEKFKRDLARIQGGENDFCLVAELDLDKLRAFQSRAKRWPENDDSFKPVPEGFKISTSRRRLPPR